MGISFPIIEKKQTNIDQSLLVVFEVSCSVSTRFHPHHGFFAKKNMQVVLFCGFLCKLYTCFTLSLNSNQREIVRLKF